MPVFSDGEYAMPPASAGIVDPKAMVAGTYYFQYHAPPFAFSLISASTIDSAIRSWIALKNDIAGSGDALLNVRGVNINTDTGDIFIIADVNPIPCTAVQIGGQSYGCEDVMKSGVNPYAVFLIIGALGAALGIAITLVVIKGGAGVAKAGGVALGVSFAIVLLVGGAFLFLFVLNKSNTAT